MDTNDDHWTVLAYPSAVRSALDITVGKLRHTSVGRRQLITRFSGMADLLETGEYMFQYNRYTHESRVWPRDD